MPDNPWYATRALPIAFVVLAGACGDTAAPTEPLVPCAVDQEVTVSVTAEALPLITWSPNCTLALMTVKPETDQPTLHWSVYSGDRAPENPLASGIRYGELPDGFLQEISAKPLVPGTAYRVTVYRFVGGTASSGTHLFAGETFIQP